MRDLLNSLFPFDIIPEQASTFAERVDPLYYFLCILSFAITGGIFVALIYLSVRYRRIEGHERESQPLDSPLLEITWTIIPSIVLVAIFVWGAKLYADYQRPPESAMQIDVVAKQWMWKIQHPNGVREVNNLHIPVGRPIRLNMTSQDVLHDFYVPEFRVKNDVIPGRFACILIHTKRPKWISPGEDLLCEKC